MPKKRSTRRRQTRSTSPTRALYLKQRRRIQSTISRYRRAGYDVQFAIPSTPKKITPASVRRLAKITPATIRSSTYDVDVTTGEQISYARSRRTPTAATAIIRQERKQAREAMFLPSPTSPNIEIPEEEVPDLSSIIISNFRTHVSYYPERSREIVLDWLNRMLADYPENQVADMLQKGREQGVWLEPREVYSTEALYAALAEMASFIGLDKQSTQEMMDELDYEYEDWEGWT